MAEDNRKKIIDKIPEMRMIDDTFMSAVFDGQKEETALLLRIVLGKSDIEVMAVKAQVFFSNRRRQPYCVHKWRVSQC